MNNPNHHERRRFHRICFDAQTSLRLKDADLPATLVDISLNGVLIEAPAGWHGKVGDAETVKILLTKDEGHTITMETTVAHVDGRRLGMQCRYIDMESISLLRRLMELNLGDPKLLERELEALG